MAKLRKKTRKITIKNKPLKVTNKSFFDKFSFPESYTSLILGALAVLIAGILFISFAKVNRSRQVSSIMTAPKTWEQISQDPNTSSSYTVNVGDDLWSISENFYKDGNKWVEIAKVNNLENPGLIYSGDKIVLPTPTPSAIQKSTAQNVEQNPQAQNTVVENNSITGNTYSVVAGDSLWDISVRAYGDGFRWPEIAKANSLVNPDLIHPGNVFIIPR